ncbi:hypothetical protein F383_20999 [Gossypium arboreum]|uniref:Uncharacterized protein n=1 Tax=Gossypium arboreum TaxID=29729 RepID=A0A0B0NQQ2_GOSAR|nr:hypothetical protein F383_20999 [Gossypium arboreum]
MANLISIYRQSSRF